MTSNDGDTHEESWCAGKLSQELAMIQGPPGTGKSYVGVELIKTLLANTMSTPAATSLRRQPSAQPVVGPILIVCLTNHALDQFLEALHAAGITGIVRVGTG
jgi:superfamily II DNA or RNA helicase